jgi:hypothetical protein
MTYDIRESVMACLFLGIKTDDVNRRIRDLVPVFYYVFKKRDIDFNVDKINFYDF